MDRVREKMRCRRHVDHGVCLFRFSKKMVVLMFVHVTIPAQLGPQPFAKRHGRTQIPFVPPCVVHVFRNTTDAFRRYRGVVQRAIPHHRDVARRVLNQRSYLNRKSRRIVDIVVVPYGYNIPGGRRYRLVSLVPDGPSFSETDVLDRSLVRRQYALHIDWHGIGGVVHNHQLLRGVRLFQEGVDRRAQSIVSIISDTNTRHVGVGFHSQLININPLY